MEQIAQVVADGPEVADEQQVVDLPLEILSKIGGGNVNVNF